MCISVPTVTNGLVLEDSGIQSRDNLLHIQILANITFSSVFMNFAYSCVTAVMLCLALHMGCKHKSLLL